MLIFFFEWTYLLFQAFAPDSDIRHGPFCAKFLRRHWKSCVFFSSFLEPRLEGSLYWLPQEMQRKVQCWAQGHSRTLPGSRTFAPVSLEKGALIQGRREATPPSSPQHPPENRSELASATAASSHSSSLAWRCSLLQRFVPVFLREEWPPFLCHVFSIHSVPNSALNILAQNKAFWITVWLLSRGAGKSMVREWTALLFLRSHVWHLESSHVSQSGCPKDGSEAPAFLEAPREQWCDF